jgi:hypothetical protein
MFTYEYGSVKRFFAATETSIYDVTTVINPQTVVTATELTGQRAGQWSTVTVSNAGGNVLVAVNGQDEPQHFNGSAWSVDPKLTAPGYVLNPSTLSHVWLWKNRLLFIEGGSMRAWYLGVDEIGGELKQINLGGVFDRGGALYFGATVSFSANDAMAEMCVFVSTKGECAVYRGTDPGDADAWSLVGVYDIGLPLGRKAHLRDAGDLVIATELGLIRLSSAMAVDKAALTISAISGPIEPDWRNETSFRKPGIEWACVKWDRQGYALITRPTYDGSVPYCLVVNLTTGAWSKYVGWDGQTVVEFDRWVYFGTTDGRIMRAELGGTDDGQPYLATAIFQYDHIKKPGVFKVAKLARLTFLAGIPFNVKPTISVDYVQKIEPYPAAATDIRPIGWDLSLWDDGEWDEVPNGIDQISTRWVGVYGAGFALGPGLQVTCNSVNTPDAELISYELMYEEGGIVV